MGIVSWFDGYGHKKKMFTPWPPIWKVSLSVFGRSLPRLHEPNVTWHRAFSHVFRHRTCVRSLSHSLYVIQPYQTKKTLNIYRNRLPFYILSLVPVQFQDMAGNICVRFGSGSTTWRKSPADFLFTLASRSIPYPSTIPLLLFLLSTYRRAKINDSKATSAFALKKIRLTKRGHVHALLP